MNQEPGPARNIEWADLHKYLTLEDKRQYVRFVYERTRVPEDPENLTVFGFQELIWQMLPDLNKVVHPEASHLAKTLFISDTKPAPSPLLLFVWHETLDLSESKCVFVHSDDVHAKSLDFSKEGDLNDDTRTCDGNSPEDSMQHLVDGFCQHLDCPRDPTSNGCLDEEETLLAGYLLQHLFKAWNGRAGAFDTCHKWPFGIRGVKRVARETCLTKFTPNIDRVKSTSKEPVNLIFHWGQGRLKLLMEIDINPELRRRGFFKFIVHPYPIDEAYPERPAPVDSDRREKRPAGYDFPDFGLFFMLQHTDPEFVKHFIRRREVFTNVLSLASCCFLQSLEYIGSEIHLAQRPIQQEERRRFLEVTRPVADDAPARRRERLAKESSLVQQFSTGDIIPPSQASGSQQSTTSSRKQQGKLSNTSESSSVASAVSSTDTFTRAVEHIDPKKDCSTPKGALSPPKPVSPVSSKPVTTLTSVPATADTEPTNLESVATEVEITESHQSNPIQVDMEEEHMLPATLSSQELPEEKSEIEAKAVTESPPATDLVLATESSQPSPEVKTETEAMVATEPPHTSTDTIADASSSLSLWEKHPAPLQTNITHSTPSSTRFRGTREVLTIMSPIDEEESTESRVNDAEVSQASTTNTDPTVPQDQSLISTPALTANIAFQPSQTSRRPISSSTSQRAADHITARILASPRRQPSLVGRPAQPGQMAAALLSSPPLFSYNQPHNMTNCWLESCGGPTMSSDNRTAACPRCGDHSYVRYCSSTHLLSDMREHYINHCGRRANILLVDESSMSPLRTVVRPFIRVAQEIHDSVERHRQALYHAHPPESETSTNSTRPPSDYYVFSDADRFDASGLQVTVDNLYAYRGTGGIAGRVRYNQTDPRKALFATLLERLLALGVSAGSANTAGCRLLFAWIKENLVGQNQWTEIMITRMGLAMQMEFGWVVAMELRN